MKNGKVKWFSDQKGFGFIEQENGEDIFVHKNEVRNKYLQEGDKVTFEIADGEKGPCAVKVVVC